MVKLRGFTLVELLTAIAIVAVLVALLLPVLTAARHASKASVCASNLRQLSKATLMYTQDHDEYFPLSFHRLLRGEGRCVRTVWGCLRPYLGDYQVALCPADLQPIALGALRSVPMVATPLCEGEPSAVSLMLNWCLAVNAITYPQVPPVSLARLPYPASTGFWFDGWLGSEDERRFEPLSGIDPRHGHRTRVPDRVLNGQEERYHGQVQASFVDGHVRMFRARLRPDVVLVDDVFQVRMRPSAIDGQRKPVWLIQGGIYHNRISFFGWPSRPREGQPERFLMGCCPRHNYCDEEWE
ncbi:MAG: prepilin-type N-terminal cleavage/methylation domain-containing protein [Armatimonadota bacterium]|nr:prepilin-type N-terminal cleavage/methylation domain-containing protein [Armatimonadota bacterium]